MTNVTILLLCVAISIAACGNDAPETSDKGKTLFHSKSCILCHGENADGTPQGPKLRNLEKRYSREQLVEYLKDPDAFREKNRFPKLSRTYPAMMPRYGYLEEAELHTLVDYVLTL